MLIFNNTVIYYFSLNSQFPFPFIIILMILFVYTSRYSYLPPLIWKKKNPYVYRPSLSRRSSPAYNRADNLPYLLFAIITTRASMSASASHHHQSNLSPIVIISLLLFYNFPSLLCCLAPCLFVLWLVVAGSF